MRLQGARRRDPTALGLRSEDEDAICLHWLRSDNCRYGKECAHNHRLPPDATELEAYMRDRRAAEAKLEALKAQHAPTSDVAAAAEEVKALRPRLRAIQRRESPGNGGRSARGRRRTSNTNRTAALHRFLLDTYGEALLSSGRGVLDVAGGGACTFAWEAVNLHRLPVTVVDPRAPEVLPKRFARLWARHTARRGEAGPELQLPRFWPCYWRDELWQAALEGDPPALEGDPPALEGDPPAPEDGPSSPLAEDH